MLVVAPSPHGLHCNCFSTSE